MKRFAKRCLAVILSIALVFSINPVQANAAATAGTYVKITDQSQLITGDYVMVVESGYAAGAYDPSIYYLSTTSLAPAAPVGNQVTISDTSLVWNVNVVSVAATGSAITLTDGLGNKIKPKGGNNNGISTTTDTYSWDCGYNGDGTFTIKGTGLDTVTLASTLADTTNTNKFRAYKNTTVSSTPDKYLSKITFYKFDPSIPSGPMKAAPPTANPPSGAVVASGSAITLSSAASGSSIQYRVTSVSPSAIQVYTSPIIITEDTTIVAKTLGTSPDTLDSDEVTFSYTLAKDPVIDPTLADPITSLPDGAISIKDIVTGTLPTTEITTVGQLVYLYGSKGTIDSAIIEDVTDGQIYAIQLFKAALTNNVGDIIKVTGMPALYKGVIQFSNNPKVELLTASSSATTVIQPQVFTTFGELKAMKNSLLSEYVVIKNVTLGATSGDYTTVTDSTGDTMQIYKAATYPYAVLAGDKVDLYAAVSKYNTSDQLRNGTSADYLVTNDTKSPAITIPSLSDAEKGKNYSITAIIQDNVGVTEAKLTYTVKGVPTIISLVKNSTDSTKWEGMIPVSTFAKDVTSFTVQISAKDSAGNVASTDVTTVNVADEPQVTSATPARNAKTGDVKKPLISVTAVNLGTEPTATLTLKSGDTVIINAAPMSFASGTFSYTPSENLADGRYTASVVITRKDGNTITYEWPFNVGTPEYSLYFGQLHSHTTISDGSGSLDDALNYINSISDSDNIDFVAFTDHSNYFDTKTEVNPEGALYDKSLMTAGSQTAWNDFKNKVATFNASPTNRGVIALGGYEMTWSGGPGHMNTWNTEGVVSRNNETLNNKKSDGGLKAYYALLSQSEGANSISQFNHPGTTFGTFSDFAYWDPIIDSRISLLEVGNGEGAIGSGGYFPSYNYYTMALDKGWHVAPTNNQDNHKGKWGNANDARDVILTDDFTEQGIYDALKDRRVYASEDKNLEITYTLNNEVMGSCISDVPTALNLTVSLSDADDEIQKAEVIANSGRIVYSWDVNAQNKDLTTTLTPSYSYYYIRVTEKDGDLAVTAPVWVGKTKMLGISNVEGSTSTPVTDEKLTIKTTLFNSEANDATITSLTYKLDGVVIDTMTNAGTVAKGTNFAVDYDFMPIKAKLQTITVEAVLAIDGVEYSFTKDLSLDVRDANKLVYIGIDGSHNNEYVKGNYYDSMGNFSKLAAESNVRCVILNTSEQLLAAARNENGKYKMIILTAPSRRNGTKLRDPYKNYSDEEIAAIKGFSEAGGSLILCGWSDLYENYAAFPAADHMAAQQNKLLSAIGATLRISDDGAYDDVLNAGGSEANKARLYLTTYNWDNALTKGIVYDAANPNDNKYTQRFSQYGGGTVYAVDKDGNPVTVLPSNISPIVYGHSSTYSKDCDNDGVGGASIPKYEYAAGDNRLMVLASETVTHANGMKSLVIVDGAAFMSNFEIQATISDTNAELNYSNFTILQNVIQYVNPTKIDTVADVQKEAEEGVKFTVEGIVTSNASGFDKATAFFDCIYLQDGTAGINAFPVAGDFKVGQKVRITGTTSSYQGERQLNVLSISLVDSNVTQVQPIKVTAAQVNDKTYLGSLVKITGTVAGIELANGAVQTVLVRDSEGKTARLFIDGYITTTKGISNLAVGNKVTAVGLSSYDNTFVGLAARIRIRDRADIVCEYYSSSGSSGNQAPATPSVTPEPVKPSPEPAAVVLTPENVVNKVANGKATVKIEISEKTLTDTLKEGNNKVDLSLSSDVLKEVLTDSKVKKGVVIDIAIPAVKDAEVNKIALSSDALLLAKESGQKLTINVADEKGYTVSIPASELKKINADSKDLNIAVSLQKDTEAANKAAGVLTIGSEGALAAGMVVTVPVKDLSVNAGDKVFIYYRNATTGKLEEIPNNQKIVADNGSLKLSTVSGGDYVICTEQVKDAVKLVDKAEVSVKSSVGVGKKLSVNVDLPKELAQVTSFAKGDPIGQEEAKITYKVNNSSLATISSDGTLVAKKKGLVKVTVEVTLENGDKRTFTKKIRIK